MDVGREAKADEKIFWKRPVLAVPEIRDGGFKSVRSEILLRARLS